MTSLLPRSLSMPSTRTLALAALGALAVLLLAGGPLEAQQAGGLGSQNLRAYRFVFLAYAIAWILVFGWIVAVARRLSRLDSRLRD